MRQIAACLILGIAVTLSGVDTNTSLLSGDEVVSHINSRKTGDEIDRVIEFVLTDKRGKQRTQTTRAFRKKFGEEFRSVIFYTHPKNVRGTAFLTYDYSDYAKDDDQWLYLPAMRKVRRISSANRGDYFLGTDLTYDDMKHEWDLAAPDYTWTTLKRESWEDTSCYVIEGVPSSPSVASEVGYSKTQIWVDDTTWMKRMALFWDSSGNRLKTVRFDDLREIDGIWTAHELSVVNHKTGHKTMLRMSEVKYNIGIEDDVFTELSLKRGI